MSLITQYRYDDLHRYIRGGWSALWNDAAGPKRESLRLLPPSGGKRYRGTADAVWQNRELFEADDAEFVLVLSGDHVYHMDYRSLLRSHVEAGAQATVCAVEHPAVEAVQFGVLEVQENRRVTGFEEKPKRPRTLPGRSDTSLASMGIYVFNTRALLDALRAVCGSGTGHDFGHHVLPSLISTGGLYTHVFRDDVHARPRYWRDIGTVDGYYRASMDLVGADPAFDPYANECHPSQPTRHPSIWGHASVRPMTGEKVEIHRTVVAPGVEIGESAVIEDSVLLPGVRIGKGVRLRRVIVDEGVHLPEGYRAGFHPGEDRQRHEVTASGVVVIEEAAAASNVAPQTCRELPALA